ncbi:MAG TPA: hypothetical protein PKI15_07580 [Candidatus Cloacimonadota bacterium]|nr:hypothetical protein [Candidatus Cloacimonadota bacterium]
MCGHGSKVGNFAVAICYDDLIVSTYLPKNSFNYVRDISIRVFCAYSVA